jgi:hypothetical protein
MDGWTADGTSTHYIAIFAGYQHPKTGEYNEVLLALTPTLDEDDMGANAHIELFESTMDIYGLEKSNILCLIGDNCNTNKAISDRWDVPLVGCASHRFNLAVKKWIREQNGLQEALDDLATLMSKASYLKAAALLRNLTQEAHGCTLAARHHNKTRWTSLFSMVQRYFRIKDQLESVDSLEEYWLSAARNQKLRDAQEHFKIFWSITEEIQKQDMDLLHVRRQFDILLEEDCYQCMSEYIAEDADFVCSRHFESGCLKIMNGERLSDAEAEACAKLRKEWNEDQEEELSSDDDGPVSVLDKLHANRKKRRKLSKDNDDDPSFNSKDYRNVSKIVCATSNCCERLFSEAKYVMVPHRRGLSPIVFEALLYLKKNRRYWNVRTVSKAIRMKDENVNNLQRDDDSFYD